jgi:hypothetical protein
VARPVAHERNLPMYLELDYAPHGPDLPY